MSKEKVKLSSVEGATCEEKVTYLSKDEAKRAKHSQSKHGRKASVYKCRNCYCFHLTSYKEAD